MTVTIVQDAPQSGWLKIKLLGNAVAAGLVGQIYNPEGVLLHICDALLYVETESTLASTFNIGIAATGVDNADLASAVDMNALGAGTVWRIIGMDRASEAAATTPWGLLWPATSYLTVTSAANASTDLVAYLFVRYIRLA